MTPNPPPRADNGSTEAPAVGTGDAEVVDLVQEDLLVEDVSIDGMCGVY